MSNIATMTISFCDFTGTIKCEYKEDVFPNLPYYSQCKPNYSYWLIPYSVCKLISTFPSNTFLMELHINIVTLDVVHVKL